MLTRNNNKHNNKTLPKDTATCATNTNKMQSATLVTTAKRTLKIARIVGTKLIFKNNKE